MPQPVRGPRVAQHDLGHELGRAVRRRRRRAIVLAHRHALGIAVDRGGRGEDEMAHAVLDRGLDQRARVRGVVAVIAERIADRVRHHDRGGEMDDGVDPVLREQRRNAGLIAGVADDERHVRRHRPVEAGREIVEHHHALAGIGQRVNHVASDIAGAAGHQGRHAAECLDVAGITPGNTPGTMRQNDQHRWPPAWPAGTRSGGAADLCRRRSRERRRAASADNFGSRSCRCSFRSPR